MTTFEVSPSDRLVAGWLYGVLRTCYWRATGVLPISMKNLRGPWESHSTNRVTGTIVLLTTSKFDLDYTFCHKITYCESYRHLPGPIKDLPRNQNDWQLPGPCIEFKGAGGLHQDFLETDFLVVSDREE